MNAGPELVKMAVLAKRSGVPAATIKHYLREGLIPGLYVALRATWPTTTRGWSSAS